MMIRFIGNLFVLVRKLLFWLIFLSACWLLYSAFYPTHETFGEMEARAERWCEEKLGPQPPKSKYQLELTEFDDCVDAEVRLYSGSAFFGPLFAGILGGFMILIYIVYWGVRFAWRFYQKRKRKRLNPFD
jgi:hypothetical protein